MMADIAENNVQTDHPVFLPLSEVVRRTSLSRSTLLALVKSGDFPRPLNVTPNRSAYLESDVIEWQMKIITRNGRREVA